MTTIDKLLKDNEGKWNKNHLFELKRLTTGEGDVVTGNVALDHVRGAKYSITYLGPNVSSKPLADGVPKKVKKEKEAE